MTAISTARLQELQKARKILVVVFLFNFGLSVAKLVCGFCLGILSMAAEGFHSLLDACANAVAVLGLSISMKPPDEGHPYGHRKFEALSAIAISFFMFLASFEVVQEVLHRLASPEPHIPRVNFFSYAVIVATLLVNYSVSSWETRRGKDLKCNILVADAKHNMADLGASLAVLITMLAIQLKFHNVDIICSLAIVGFILKEGFSIIMSHLGPLLDEAVLDPVLVEKVVLSVDGVSSCHKIRSRGMDDHIFLDLHVQVPGHLSIEQAHAISFQVEERLKENLEGVGEVLVHLEDDSPPFTASKS